MRCCRQYVRCNKYFSASARLPLRTASGLFCSAHVRGSPSVKLRLFLGLCPLPPQRLSLLGLLKKKTHIAYDRSTEAPDLL
jgi:hypothetical protein